MNRRKEIFIICLFGLMVLSRFLLFKETVSDESSFNDKKKVTKEQVFLSAETNPIFIDGEATGVGAHNWSWVETQSWFGGGNGTYSNPYIIENLIINGNYSKNCLEIRNSKVYFTIRYCTFYNSSYRRSIPFSAGIQLRNVDNGTIIRNNLVYNGGLGINLRNCVGNSIVNNTAFNNNMRGIGLSSSHYNNIKNNSLSNKNSGISLYMSNNNQILNNTVIDGGGSGIFLGLSNFNNISFCTSVNNSGGGISINGNNNTIFRNIMKNNTGSGISLINAVNCFIIENIIINNKESGIYVENSDNITILDNYITNNEFNGIDFITLSVISKYNKVLRNNITFNENIGLYIDNLQESLISGNNISDNGYYGIIFFGDSNVISKNVISRNHGGIHMSAGEDNNITQNIISDNKFKGISIGGSFVNLIYNNTFLRNTPNAIDNDYLNYWDNGVIGNLWDDYIGLDTNDNGIGDTPYNKNYILDNFPIYWDPPAIIINYPNPEMIFELSPSFNISISEGIINTTWYSLGNGMTNITFTELIGYIDQVEWNKSEDGVVYIRFYANDSRGYVGMAEVEILKISVIKNKTSEQIIPGFNLFLVFGVFFIALMAIKQKIRKKMK